MDNWTGEPIGLVGRIFRKLAPTRFGVWFILHVFAYLDPLLLRMTRGRFSLSGLSGVPIGLLTTIGAKSGLERSVPLLFCPDGENVILISSYGGGSRNPGWYYNLRANPEARLLARGYTGAYISKEVTGKERELLWEKALRVYSGFGNYAVRAKERQIPVLLLERKKNRDWRR